MVQSSGSLQAKIAIVGEFPSEQDILRNEPFCGTSGTELSKMLNEAGTDRTSCFLSLVVNDRVPRGRVDGLVALKKKLITPAHVQWNGKYVLPQLLAGVERLKRELEQLKPNVVCAMGNLAMWVLTGQWGVTDWRSSVMESTLIPGLKVIPTLSPNVLYGQWSQRVLIVHDLKRVVRESETPKISRADYKFVIRPNFDEARMTLLDLVQKAQQRVDRGMPRLELGGDIETRWGHIACIAFAWSPTEAICIPLMCQNKPEGYWNEEEEAELVWLMYQLCQFALIDGQNWNYDAQYIFRHWGFTVPEGQVFDTMLAHHSCFSNLPKNLAFISSMYLEDHLYWKDDRTNWTEGPKGEGEDQFWRYNCTDSCRTLAAARVLRDTIAALKMDSVNEFQQGMQRPVLRTMIKGIRLDEKRRAEFSLTLLDEAAKRQHWLADVLGEEVNVKSPKQMQELFYEKLGQRVIRKRNDEGILVPTTNDEALRKIAEREPILRPVIRRISELRSIGVFHSTFVNAAVDIDGRIRTSFNIAGTETYRFASSKNAFGTGLNCQNIPNGSEAEADGLEEPLELPNCRMLFVPDQGMEYFDIDLDSADLRIVTFESDCAWMKDQFRNGRKPYVEVMKEYFHNQSMTKNSKEYPMFKALCHGTNYLGTPDGIAPRIGLLVHETERIQKWYYGMCPEIKVWQDEIKKQVQKRRYIENVFGYRTYYFDKIEGTIFNQAVAWIPQSSVGCLINRAYKKIDADLKHIEVLLQVHDSLAGQFPAARSEECKAQILKAAEVVLPYSDPLIIPVGIKTSTKSWGECK